MEVGTVLWYDISAGHGRIKPASGGEAIILLFSGISPDAKGKIPTLFPGDEVKYKAEELDRRITPLGLNLGPGTVATRVVVTSQERTSSRKISNAIVLRREENHSLKLGIIHSGRLIFLTLTIARPPSLFYGKKRTEMLNILSRSSSIYPFRFLVEKFNVL